MKIRSPFNPNASRVLPAGKPPKLRFRPGDFITHKGRTYEIVYAYRLKEKPTEWQYCLGERAELKSRYSFIDLADRIVYSLFHSWYEANCHFLWATHESTTSMSTKSILQHGGLISSGEVLPGVTISKTK